MPLPADIDDKPKRPRASLSSGWNIAFNLITIGFCAICAGTPTHLLLFRHVLPNTIPALIVQGTFVCASAILLEAILSFLGIGIPPETPTWGNIMAEGRGLFRIYPHNIFFPGICLALTVLAVNVLGDGLRDKLDPKLARRV